MRHALWLGALIGLASIFAGCKSTESSPPAVDPWKGRTIELRHGQAFNLSLEADHAAGLSWTFLDSGEGVLVQEGAPAYISGVEDWSFRAAKPGQQTVQLDYRNPAETGVAPIKSITFTVIVR